MGQMRAAGVNQAGGPVVPLDLADPRPLRDGEILLQVQAGGVGNWDEFVRTGDWDTGARPPMALGVEAARSGAADAVRAVRPGGRLATITGDPPPAERGITVRAIQVEPDGPRLARLAGLLGHGVLRVTVSATFPLDQAAQALAQVRRGAHGTAIVLRPGSAELRR
jgi:NADPH:quinone reductase-like Zn-dependent oxidoreductase